MKKEINRENLYQLYIIDRKKVIDIAKECDIKPSTVYKKLKQFDIKTRTHQEAWSSIKNRDIISSDANWKGFQKISGSYFSRLILHANIRKYEFKITIEYAWYIFEKQNGKCALTGESLIFANKGNIRKDLVNQTASLDRIDSKKGYVEGNIQWLHKDINALKSKFDEKHFIELCKKVANYNNA